MKFNKFKYYLIVFLLMASIICLFVFPSTSSINLNNEVNPDTEIEENLPQDAPITPDSPSSTLPSFKAWDKLWEYSLNIALKGFTSNVSATVTTASPLGDVTQSVKSTESYGNGKFLKETFSHNNVAKEGTYYENIYYENGILYTRKTNNVNYEQNLYTYTSEPKQENKADFKPSFTTLNTCTLTKDTVVKNTVLFDTVSNKTYYIIKLDYKVDKIPQSYEDVFLASGLAKDVIPKSISFEIRIYKHNAHLAYIKTTENYITYSTILPSVGLNCTGVTTQTFKMNESPEINRGY